MLALVACADEPSKPASQLPPAQGYFCSSGALAQLTSSPDNNVFPAVVGTAQGRLAVWDQVPHDLSAGTIWLRRWTDQAMDDAVVVEADVFADQSTILWTGEAAVVAWVARDAQDCLRTRPYDASGAPLGAVTEVLCVSGGQGFPSLAVAGGRLAAAWLVEVEEDVVELQLVPMDGQGRADGEVRRLQIPEIERAVLTGADDGWRLATGRGGGLWVARLGADLSAGEEAQVILREEGERIDLVGVVSTALAWLRSSLEPGNESDPVLHMASLDGLALGTDYVVSDPSGFAARPSNLVYSDLYEAVAVAWTDAPTGGDTTLHAAMLDLVGATSLVNVEVGAADGTFQVEPAVVAAPDGVDVVWRAAAPIGDVIRATRLTCAYAD
ncbi:MAG: hypothetical protein H6730_13380 [Deltaproteobacteria bacterium]|nr:hypothetical protein [Deltaproteobacteria bacterium]